MILPFFICIFLLSTTHIMHGSSYQENIAQLKQGAVQDNRNNEAKSQDEQEDFIRKSTQNIKDITAMIKNIDSQLGHTSNLVVISNKQDQDVHNETIKTAFAEEIAQLKKRVSDLERRQSNCCVIS